jgi:hypothetical protein
VIGLAGAAQAQWLSNNRYDIYGGSGSQRYSGPTDTYNNSWVGSRIGQFEHWDGPNGQTIDCSQIGQFTYCNQNRY